MMTAPLMISWIVVEKPITSSPKPDDADKDGADHRADDGAVAAEQAGAADDHGRDDVELQSYSHAGIAGAASRSQHHAGEGCRHAAERRMLQTLIRRDVDAGEPERRPNCRRLRRSDARTGRRCSRKSAQAGRRRPRVHQIGMPDTVSSCPFQSTLPTVVVDDRDRHRIRQGHAPRPRYTLSMPRVTRKDGNAQPRHQDAVQGTDRGTHQTSTTRAASPRRDWFACSQDGSGSFPRSSRPNPPTGRSRRR